MDCLPFFDGTFPFSAGLIKSSLTLE